MTIAFLVARPRQTGCHAFPDFRKKSGAVARAFSGHVIDTEAQGAAGVDPVPSSGAMVVAFGSIAQGRGFFESDAYAELRKDRRS